LNYSFVPSRIEEIRKRIACAAEKSGRTSESVIFMAVTKFHTQEAVLAAYESGIRVFGENKIQEAEQKFSGLFINQDSELHIIGHLQSNKAKTAVEIASMVESVDSLKIILELNKRANEKNKIMNILLELHTAEDTKSGFASIDDIKKALDELQKSDCKNICIKGLMTMAPWVKEEKPIRKSFISLRESSLLLKKEYPKYDFSYLSMGMTNDYEIAIEEGSSQVRIGTSIFGNREY